MRGEWFWAGFCALALCGCSPDGARKQATLERMLALPLCDELERPPEAFGAIDCRLTPDGTDAQRLCPGGYQRSGPCGANAESGASAVLRRSGGAAGVQAMMGQRQQRSEGLSRARSNHGGWHSHTDMLDWGGPAAAKLAQSAIGLAKRMSHFQESSPEAFDWVVRMWANVTPPGGLNQLHAHPQNLWAAVLYIDIGEGDGGGEARSGALFLEDPRFPMCAMHNTAFRIIGVDGQPQAYQPELRLKAGSLVVFPAWLRHGVRPHQGGAERITIAMNIDALARARI